MSAVPILLGKQLRSWAFVAAGAVANGLNPSPALPAGIIVGDALLLFAGVQSTGQPANPAGWDLINGIGIGTVPPYWYMLWIRYAADGDAAPTVTGADVTTGVILAYRAFNGIGEFSAGAAVTDSSAPYEIPTNSLTTAVADELVISMFGTIPVIPKTWGAPADTTTRVLNESSATTHGILIVEENKATAGATTVRTATQSSASTMVSLAFAFHPES